MDYLDDTCLLSAIQEEDIKAFEYLFKSYFPRLRAYALHFVEDEETASDIVQECFLKFWEKRQALQAVSLSSLLFSMVRNACLNYLKHLCIVENHRLEFLAHAEGEERLYYVDFNYPTDSPLLYEELLQQIKLVMSQLPDRCREVFVMSRFQGLKNREIADKLQISTKAVEKHISKALGMFAKHFKNKYSMEISAWVLAWLMA